MSEINDLKDLTLLPFYTAPRYEITTIGDESIGTIQITKKNDITLFEQKFVDEYMSQSEDIGYVFQQLANKISHDTQLPTEEARLIILGEKDDENDILTLKSKKKVTKGELRNSYFGEINKINDLMLSNANRRKIAIAASLIKFRLTEGSIGDDTAIDQAGQLPISIVDLLVDFWNLEVNHGKEPDPKLEIEEPSQDKQALKV